MLINYHLLSKQSSRRPDDWTYLLVRNIIINRDNIARRTSSSEVLRRNSQTRSTIVILSEDYFVLRIYSSIFTLTDYYSSILLYFVSPVKPDLIFNGPKQDVCLQLVRGYVVILPLRLNLPILKLDLIQTSDIPFDCWIEVSLGVVVQCLISRRAEQRLWSFTIIVLARNLQS